MNVDILIRWGSKVLAYLAHPRQSGKESVTAVPLVAAYGWLQDFRDALQDWGDRWLYGFGRLRPGVAPAAASRELAAIAGRWVEAGHVHDQGDRRLERSAVPVAELMTRRIRPALRVLVGTVACIH